MQSQKRFVAIALICFSVLMYMTFDRFFVWLWTYFSIEDYSFIPGWFSLTTLLASAIAIATGVTCWCNSKVNTLLTEVVDEVKKVTWPTREETVAATIVVLITVFIFGAYLGALDALFTWLSSFVLDTKGIA